VINPFFRNNGPFKISDILQLIDLDDLNIDNDQEIIDIKDLFTSKKNDITFFHSKKYKDIAKNTKASFCLTTEILKDELPKSCTPLIVENVLFSTSKVTSKYYPSSINDNFDYTARDISETKFKDKVQCGKNILVGDNVTIGSNCLIGHILLLNKMFQLEITAQ
jgi:UDP-3-O-[3-hydroxymyristoyl] glucosamine N-acyltransferase